MHCLLVGMCVLDLLIYVGLKMALEYVIWTLTRLTTSKVITKLPSYHFVK